MGLIWACLKGQAQRAVVYVDVDIGNNGEAMWGSSPRSGLGLH